MKRSQMFKLALLAGFTLLAGTLVLQTKPVTHVRCEYGTPTAVTVYSLGNLAGMILVQDGAASKVELLGQQRITELVRETQKVANLRNQPFIDPRFSPSDADRYIVDTWSGGEQIRQTEAYSCDESTVAQFVQQIFSAAKIQHRYQCS